MKNNAIYVSELSTSTHVFCKYHFCRGNSNKRKTRLGLIRKGHGSYLYLNKRLEVREGDLVFIPENVYCYSEWHGEPEIEVVYVSGFLHYDAFRYEPQVIDCDEDAKGELMARVCRNSSSAQTDRPKIRAICSFCPSTYRTNASVMLNQLAPF